jgi:hypothetical protein
MTSRSAVLALLTALFTSVSLPLSAQEPDKALNGERVRFRNLGEGEERIDGILRGTEGDFILIAQPDSEEILRVPFMDVRAFSRSARETGRVGCRHTYATQRLQTLDNGAPVFPQP